VVVKDQQEHEHNCYIAYNIVKEDITLLKPVLAALANLITTPLGCVAYEEKSLLKQDKN
jgi:hypothetical protein